MKQVLSVLGATGSIGLSTLDVVSRHPEKFEVFALTAFRQIEKLAELCRLYKPRIAVVGFSEDESKLRNLLGADSSIEVMSGVEALVEVASASEVTTVMAAIVGAAGLASSLAAARSGKRVLLANKEALVMAGDVFMSAIENSNAILLPVDSEHNAVFQSLPSGFNRGLAGAGVRKITLTASGGPFRTLPLEAFSDITPSQACKHPNWSMGRKISVDSATMMNKGLEVIEASLIFGVSHERIDVLIHPESVVHSMVQYEDGAVIAELGNPDMRTPIAHALAYPQRIESGVSNLELVKWSGLTFEVPDLERFPCLSLAYSALESGRNAPTILNAANEVAVEAFLNGEIRFNQISQIVDFTLSSSKIESAETLESVMSADGLARCKARSFVRKYGNLQA